MYGSSIWCVPKKNALVMWWMEGIMFKMLISFGALNTKNDARATFRLRFLCMRTVVEIPLAVSLVVLNCNHSRLDNKRKTQVN